MSPSVHITPRSAPTPVWIGDLNPFPKWTMPGTPPPPPSPPNLPQPIEDEPIGDVPAEEA